MYIVICLDLLMKILMSKYQEMDLDNDSDDDDDYDINDGDNDIWRNS